MTVLKKNMAPPDHTQIIYSTIVPALVPEVCAMWCRVRRDEVEGDEGMEGGEGGGGR